MIKVIEWIASNKKWIFSGIGVAVVSFIITLVIKHRRTSASEDKVPINQAQDTSEGSTAYQAGGNITITTTNNSTTKKDADIRIVSVELIDNIEEIIKFRGVWLDGNAEHVKDIGVFPIIDIKLLNKGDEPAFLSHLELDIELKKAVPDPMMYSAYPSNWEYTVLLDPHAKYDKKQISISQKVPANDIDRFVVVVGHDMDYGELKYADYKIKLGINYNEGDLLELGCYSLRVHAPVAFAKNRQVGIRQIASE